MSGDTHLGVKNGAIERGLLWACFTLLLAIGGLMLKSFANDVSDLRMQVQDAREIAIEGDRRSRGNSEDLRSLINDVKAIKSGVNGMNTKLESFLAAEAVRRESSRESN